MSKRQKISLVVPVCVLALVIIGVLLKIGATQESKLVIGGLFALTGDGADWGTTEEKAVRLAIQEANDTGGIQGKKIELIVEDGPAEKVNDSVTAFRKLVDISQVPVVLGPTWDDVAAALAPLADQTKAVVVAPDASSGIEAKKDFAFFFSVYVPENSEMTRLVKHLKSKGIKKVSTVYNQDPFSQQWRDTFVTEAKRAGLNVVSEFPISDPDAKDFRTQISRLKQVRPDAVYVEFTSQDTKGPFMRQAKELGLTTVLVSSSTSQSESILEKYGTYMEGLIYAFPQETQRQKEFLKKYKAQYGEAPKAPAAPYAYDAASMIVKVLRDGARTSEEIRKALLAIKDFQGASADHISFNDQGRVQWPAEEFVIKTIKGGKFTEVKKLDGR
jgi:branched-chain amino acid transport system substrate-binding protein